MTVLLRTLSHATTRCGRRRGLTVTPFPTIHQFHPTTSSSTCVGGASVTSVSICIRTHYHYHGPGSASAQANETLVNVWKTRDFRHRGFTVGLGGPVGSGKTATVAQLVKALQKEATTDATDATTSKLLQLGVVTNDIFTQEDADYLVQQQALPQTWIRAVETGGCPHAAIREDVSANLTALEDLTRQYYNNNHDTDHIDDTDNNRNHARSNNLLLLCESGGDNLAANFSRELADLTLYVIDVAGGDKVPRKGGPGITQSDLLIINKIDLAEAVGADLQLMQSQAQDMRRYQRGGGPSNDTSTASKEESAAAFAPIVMASIKHGQGLNEIVDFILTNYRQAMALSSTSLPMDHDHNHDHSER